jgi:hypothetical protein
LALVRAPMPTISILRVTVGKELIPAGTGFAGSGPAWLRLCLPISSVQSGLPSSARNATTLPDLPAPITISIFLPRIVRVVRIGESWKSWSRMSWGVICRYQSYLPVAPSRATSESV